MLQIKEEDLIKILPSDGPSISEVKDYLEKYNDEYIVIKCGGSVLEDQNLFNIFVKDISILNKLGFIPIIVHGGGKRISNKLKESGVESVFIKGLRVTDAKTITVVEKVLIEFNKEIVEALIDNGCKAQPVTSANNTLINVIKENEELGFVGIPVKIDLDVINKIVETKNVPVIAPLGVDDSGQTYNINADTAAGFIAKELNARRLIIMSDVEGVLDNNKKLIPELNSQSIKELIDNETISGGMIPKINTCIKTVQDGAEAAVIMDGRKKHSLLVELFTEDGVGTLIKD